MSDLPILYLKPGCPWCDEVVEFLDQRGIFYQALNVNQDREAMREMIAVSGQSKAPTMDWDGKILADFGVEELIPFLRKQGLNI